MPGGNGTGPMGMGRMTGRAAGFCAGYSVPGYSNPVPGRRRGLGFGLGSYGRGRGLGRGYMGGYTFGRDEYPYAYGYSSAAPVDPVGITPEHEAEMLKAEAKAMQAEVDAINQHVKDLEASKSSEK